MNPFTKMVCPSATTQIKADHAHVLATFHQYTPGMPLDAKRVLVNTICRALEIHAHLEEEIFYPAVYALEPGILEKNLPEHDAMKRVIMDLSHIDPSQAEYDAAFMTLMRDVMHHVADEETMLLPRAESLLGPSLDSLGAKMVTRRLELTTARMGEITRDTFSALPTSVIAGGSGALIAGSYAIRDAFKR